MSLNIHDDRRPSGGGKARGRVHARAFRHPATCFAAAARVPDKSIYDPELFPDRDSLIRFLVRTCGWPPAKVAGHFKLSDRHVRRLATPERAAVDGAPAAAAELTREDAVAMARDYLADPYISVEDREVSLDFLREHCPSLAV